MQGIPVAIKTLQRMGEKTVQDVFREAVIMSRCVADLLCRQAQRRGSILIPLCEKVRARCSFRLRPSAKRSVSVSLSVDVLRCNAHPNVAALYGLTIEPTKGNPALVMQVGVPTAVATSSSEKNGRTYESSSRGAWVFSVSAHPSRSPLLQLYDLGSVRDVLEEFPGEVSLDVHGSILLHPPHPPLPAYCALAPSLRFLARRPLPSPRT